MSLTEGSSDGPPPVTAAAIASTTAKDTPKSQRTRARILDCAMALFAEVGVVAAANPTIAERAGLTRGAMLYHFPSRELLVSSAADHIQAARARLLTEVSDKAPPGADLAEQAIDAYWGLLQTTPFIAFAELEAAGRTDPMIAAAIAPAQRAFDEARASEQFSRMLQAGSGPRFQASRDLARFMLEGLSRAQLTYDETARVANLLAVVKRVTHMLNRKGDLQDPWPDDGR
jgi:AcrR family transcriptional regulator